MRKLVILGVVGTALVLNGCSTESPLDSGVPKNVDMSKSYSPQVDMPGMSPKIQKDATAKAKAEAKNAAAAPK